VGERQEPLSRRSRQRWLNAPANRAQMYVERRLGKQALESGNDKNFAFPLRKASNFELNGLTSGEASNAAIARAIKSYVSCARTRSAVPSGTIHGVSFGPGTSEPMRVCGLSLGREQSESTFAGQ